MFRYAERGWVPLLGARGAYSIVHAKDLAGAILAVTAARRGGTGLRRRPFMRATKLVAHIASALGRARVIPVPDWAAALVAAGPVGASPTASAPAASRSKYPELVTQLVLAEKIERECAFQDFLPRGRGRDGGLVSGPRVFSDGCVREVLFPPGAGAPGTLKPFVFSWLEPFMHLRPSSSSSRSAHPLLSSATAATATYPAPFAVGSNFTLSVAGGAIRGSRFYLSDGPGAPTPFGIVSLDLLSPNFSLLFDRSLFGKPGARRSRRSSR